MQVSVHEHAHAYAYSMCMYVYIHKLKAHWRYTYVATHVQINALHFTVTMFSVHVESCSTLSPTSGWHHVGVDSEPEGIDKMRQCVKVRDGVYVWVIGSCNVPSKVRNHIEQKKTTRKHVDNTEMCKHVDSMQVLVWRGKLTYVLFLSMYVRMYVRTRGV